MKSICKLCLFELCDLLGINALSRFLNRHKAIILWYHGICDDGFKLTPRHLPKSVFRKQLSYLKNKGYVFVNLTELIDALKNKKKINKYVALTFDDGFKNVVVNAYPIIREYGAKGCFYLVSDLAGTDELLWTDRVEIAIRARHQDHFQFIFKNETINYNLADENSYQYAFENIKSKLRTITDAERLAHLEQFSIPGPDDIPKEFIIVNWEEIKTLDPDVVEIGVHTRTHPNCTKLVTDTELEDEIRNSKIDIEKNLGREARHFCYPAGDYNEQVISMVKKSGCISAVTVEDGFNDEKSDLYRLKRMVASKQFLLFKSEISGTHTLLRKLKTRFSFSG